MNKKYEFTGETIEFRGRTLHRIRRIKDGLVGGWIESERNLSQEGSCFVHNEGIVYSNGRVYDNGMVFGNGEVFGNGKVFGDGEVCGNGKVFKGGKIIGKVSLPYKNIFQYQCENRVLSAILTENDEILYSIGCQKNITKEVFLDRIYNKDGGVKENPHREEYLKLIPLIESYFGIK